MLQYISRITSARFLILLYVFAVVLRLGIIVAVGQLNAIDQYEPIIIGKNIAEGNGFSLHWPYVPLDVERRTLMETQPPSFGTTFIPPLVPYFYAGYLFLAGLSDTSLRVLMVIQAIIGALLPLMMYKATRQAFGDTAARWAAIICLLYLPAAMTAVTFSGAVFYAPALVGVVWAVLKAYKQFDVASFVMLGAMSGALSLLRSEFYYMFFIVLAVIIVVFGKKYSYTVRFRRAGIALLVFGIATGWWAIRNYHEFGKFIPVTGHPWREVWRGYNPYASGSGSGANGFKLWENQKEYAHITRALDSIPYDAQFETTAENIYKQEVLSYIKAYPTDALWLATKKAVMLWTLDIYYEKARHPLYIIPTLAVFLLSIAGVYLLLRRKEHREVLKVWGVLFVCYTGVFVITYVLPRYQSYIYPAFFPLGGYALSVLLYRASANEKTIE